MMSNDRAAHQIRVRSPGHGRVPLLFQSAALEWTQQGSSLVEGAFLAAVEAPGPSDRREPSAAALC